MEVGLYQSAASMDVLQRHLDALAFNLANTSTTGFKRVVVTNDSFAKSMGIGANKTTMPRHRESIDFSQGILTPTGNPLDFGVFGRGFLKVETARGPRYMRSGTLVPTADGGLSTATGEKVAMRGSLSNTQAPLAIEPSGEISQNGVSTGAKIELVDFENLDALKMESGGLFKGNPNFEKPATGAIRPGHLEQSNTSAVDALVGLVTVSRAFESSSRALHTVGETIQRTTTAL